MPPGARVHLLRPPQRPLTKLTIALRGLGPLLRKGVNDGELTALARVEIGGSPQCCVTLLDFVDPLPSLLRCSIDDCPSNGQSATIKPIVKPEMPKPVTVP